MYKKRFLPYLSSIITDRVSGYIFLAFLTAYLIIFAFFRGKEIFDIPFGPGAFVILIPIFLTDAIKIAVESFSPRSYFKGKEDLSKVSAIIPTKDGEDTLRQTIESLLKRFNKKNIIVASNGSRDATCDIAREYGVVLVDIPAAIGKVQAINEALSVVKTPFSLILDDDTLIGEALVPTSALDDGYDGVAFCVLPIKQGWVSVLQLHEYRKSMDIGRCFHNATASVQSISGAIGLFRTEELVRQITIHTGEFSGEDLQRTLIILSSAEKKGVVITDSVVETFVPDTLWELFKQRMIGWYPGHFANLGIYVKLIFAKHVPFRLRWEAIFSICMVSVFDLLRLITLPVLIFSPAFMVIFYVTYVVLESIPYFVMGRKEPFWVVLVAPFYGLFNFVARIAAFVVFMYRRLSYKFASGNKYDDYRTAHVYAKLLGTFVTAAFVSFIFFGFVFTRVLPNSIKTEITNSIFNDDEPVVPVEIEEQPSLTNDDEIDLEQTSTASAEIYTVYKYVVVYGDSYWRLALKATNTYLNETNREISEYKKNLMINRIISDKSKNPLSPGDLVEFSKKQIEEAYVNTNNK